jgi:cytochrome c oxidase subunit 2
MKKHLTMLVMSGCLTIALLLPAQSRAEGGVQRIEITAQRFNFMPGEITLKKGEPVILVLKSLDVDHGLRIREFGVNAIIKAGKTVEVKFTPNKSGDFIGHCSNFCGPGHGSMEIKLHVTA